MGIITAFLSGLLSKNSPQEAQRIRPSEDQIDKTLMDSFPASDPPAWY